MQGMQFERVLGQHDARSAKGLSLFAATRLRIGGARWKREVRTEGRFWQAVLVLSQ